MFPKNNIKIFLKKLLCCLKTNLIIMVKFSQYKFDKKDKVLKYGLGWVGFYFSRLRSPVRVFWATYPRNFLASYLVSMVSRVLWSSKGLVEMRVSWSGHLVIKK